MESNDFDRDFWVFGLLYFNAKFNLIQTRTAALLFGVTFLLFLVAFFLKKFIIKGYSIESYFIKSMKS
jgi:hypothetical protein